SIPITGVPAPQNLTANATLPSDVLVSWLLSNNATSYEIFRRAPGGAFLPLATVSGPPFQDVNVNADTSYLYSVRAVDGSNNRSEFSNIDLATTVVFTDDPPTAH